jgi:hypothetical protein
VKGGSNVKKCKAIVGLSLFRTYDFEAACEMKEGAAIEQRVKEWLKTEEGQAWVHTLCQAIQHPLPLCELSESWLEVNVGSYSPVTRIYERG